MEENNSQASSEKFNSITPEPRQPETVEAAPAPPKPPRESWWRIAGRYAAIWVAVFLLLKFIIPSYDVKGSSMEPTYQISGDRVLTDQLFFKLFGNIARGDIVVLSKEDVNKENLIKRVIGLPGEKLEIRKGIVYINGKALSEDYIKFKASYDYPATELSNDCYFVLGDNRPVSSTLR